jgi:hypothetical protein
MTITLFDRLACFPEVARELEQLGMDIVYPRILERVIGEEMPRGHITVGIGGNDGSGCRLICLTT